MSTLVKSTKLMKTAAGAAALLGLMGVGGQALATDTGASGNWYCPGNEVPMKVKAIAYQGTGCPPGTLDASTIVLGDQLSVLFGEDMAAEQPGPVSQRQKYCNLRVGVELPPGTTATIGNVEFTGSADLPNKWVAGRETTKFYWTNFTPLGQKAIQQFVKVGPTIDDNTGFPGPESYDKTKDFRLDAPKSRCGGTGILAIDSDVALSAAWGHANDPATINLQTIDGKLTAQTFVCRLDPCK